MKIAVGQWDFSFLLNIKCETRMRMEGPFNSPGRHQFLPPLGDLVSLGPRYIELKLRLHGKNADTERKELFRVFLCPCTKTRVSDDFFSSLAIHIAISFTCLSSHFNVSKTTRTVLCQEVTTHPLLS